MKRDIDDLAFLGGSPAFSETLHVGRPNLGDRRTLFERMRGMLDRRWLSNSGPYVRELEQRIAEMVGVKHCIAMCNGTVALEIAIRALDLKGEVIIPSFTFVATAHALQWQEITPVFCDVDPLTHTIDPACVVKMITPRTTGIIGVHLWGQTCDIDSLTDIASSSSLKLMFDAAHGLGCSHKGRMIGNFGNAEVFSFHATKFLSSAEGGAIATNDDVLAQKIRLMKNFGFSGEDRVIYVGTNGKMSEPSALMALTNLESIDMFIATNYRNYQAYTRELEGIPGVTLMRYNETERSNYQYIILEIDAPATCVTRDELLLMLRSENVLARRYFYPGCHRMEPYRSHFPHAGLLLPETERLCDRVLALPTGTAIGPEEIQKICGIIRLIVAHAPEIRSRSSALRAKDTGSGTALQPTGHMRSGRTSGA